MAELHFRRVQFRPISCYPAIVFDELNWANNSLVSRRVSSRVIPFLWPPFTLRASERRSTLAARAEGSKPLIR